MLIEALLVGSDGAGSECIGVAGGCFNRWVIAGWSVSLFVNFGWWHLWLNGVKK